MFQLIPRKNKNPLEVDIMIYYVEIKYNCNILKA